MTSSLWIYDSGATDDEIREGVRAAEAIFERSKVSAADANAAKLKLSEGELLSSQELMCCVVWDEADAAAVVACCAGWSRIPEAAHLHLDT